MKKVNIDQKHNLILNKEATFNDIRIFFDTESTEIPNYLSAFYLLEIWDNGDKYKRIANQIAEKIKKGSQDNVFDFFIKNELYVPDYPKTEEDCELFFHTKFKKN